MDPREGQRQGRDQHPRRDNREEGETRRERVGRGEKRDGSQGKRTRLRKC